MSLLRRLVQSATSVHPDPGFKDTVWRVKYCLRGLAFPWLTREWFDLLADPSLGMVARNHPHILSKLQRPYLDRRCGPRGRLDRLRDHYDFLRRTFSEAMLEEVYGPRGLLLARITLEELGEFALRLVYFDLLEKEGEMSMVLEEGRLGTPLFALTFCVTQFQPGQRELVIGGLQGFKAANDRERIVGITRAMHGLRPKALLLTALQTCAGAWQIRRLRAVSDSAHVYRHWSKRRKLAASYDEFWRECGGQRRTPDGMFDLPLDPPRRDLAEMKASKRQMYRRRYLMIEKLARQIQASLVPMGPFTPAEPLRGELAAA